MTAHSSDSFPKIVISVLLVATAVLILALNSYASLALVIAAVVMLIAVFAWRPTWGVYLLALCLPVINWSFVIGPLLLPLIDALAVISVLGFGVHLLFQPRAFMSLKFPFLLPFLFFWGATLVSAAFSSDPTASLWYSVRWILFFYVAYVFFPVNVIKDRRVLKNVLISFVISAIAMAVMGIISVKDQNLAYDPLRFTVLTIDGQKPFGLDQNLLVETLLPAIFFLLALRYWYRKEQARKVTFLLTIFLGFVLIGTFSRGGWIGLGLCTMIYLLYGQRIKLRQFLAPIIIAVLLLSPLLLHMIKLQTAYEVGVGSNRTRWLSTQIAWSNFKESPWVGKGTGEYVNLVNQNIRFRAQHGEGTDSNGIVQKVMAENGLIGLVAFGGLTAYLALAFYRHARKSGQAKALVLPLYLAALGIFVFEFFNTSYYHGKLWLPIGIAWAAMTLLKEDTSYDETA